MKRKLIIGWVYTVIFYCSVLVVNGSSTNKFSGLNFHYVQDYEPGVGRSTLSTHEGKEIRVVNPRQIMEAMQSAQPGDVIVMAKGVRKDAQIVFDGHGSEETTVTLRAEEKGKVILTGNSTLRIAGS